MPKMKVNVGTEAIPNFVELDAKNSDSVGGVYFRVQGGKIQYSTDQTVWNNTGVDTSDATAISDDILSGKIVYVNGVKVTGTMPVITSYSQMLTWENNNADAMVAVTIPKGYSDGAVKMDMTDPNFSSSNIKSGLKMFGVTGTFTSDANATAGQVLSGYSVYVKGNKVNGTIPVVIGDYADQVLATQLSTGFYSADGNSYVYFGIRANAFHQGINWVRHKENNLKPENIKKGVPILGITGTMEEGRGVNVFRQPTQPQGFNGIWIKDSVQIISQVLTDNHVTASEAFSSDVYSVNLPSNTLSAYGGGMLNGSPHYHFDNGFYRYNENNNTWTALSTHPNQRAYSTCGWAVVNNVLYTFGRGSGSEGYFREAYRYDPNNNAWSRIADLPYDIATPNPVVVGTDIYIVGGFRGMGKGDICKYNTLNNSYTVLSGVNIDRSTVASGYYNGIITSICDNGIYWTYNVATNSSYTNGQYLPSYPTSFVGGYKSLQVGNYLYVTGGWSKDLMKIDLANLALTNIDYPISDASYGSFLMLTNKGLFVSLYYASNQWKINVMQYIMTPKTYPANSVIIQRNDNALGMYYTELSSSNKPLGGVFPSLKTGFDDAHFYGSNLEKNKETYYGDGRMWIKFK